MDRAGARCRPARSPGFAVVGWSGIGPAWTAHTGGGTPGTFTATGEHCARALLCSWTGTFRSTDNLRVRTHVELGHGNDVDRYGDVVAAVDTGGADVYPAGGGYAWVEDLGFLLLAPALLAFWWFRIMGPVRRRRREEAESEPMWPS